MIDIPESLPGTMNVRTYVLYVVNKIKLRSQYSYVRKSSIFVKKAKVSYQINMVDKRGIFKTEVMEDDLRQDLCQSKRLKKVIDSTSWNTSIM